MLDKNDVLPTISDIGPVMIELGVGDRKRNTDAIGIDILDSPAVDIVGDALEILKLIPSGSVNSISSFHVFEHLEDISAILLQVERVLVSGGEMLTVVPHFSNPFFYSDPTHRKFFGLYTFSYYCSDKLFRRRVPGYVRSHDLELISVKLVFKSYPPRYFTHGFRKILQLVFNISIWMQEIYEDSFSHIVSCYEIKYTVRKK